MHKKAITLAVALLLLAPAFSFAEVSDVDPEGTTTCVSLNSTNLRYRATDAQTNGEVTILQDFLQAGGYLKTNPIGYFGLLTTAAAKAFQNANNISPTGYVGPLTRAKIKEVSCSGTGSTSVTNTTSVNGCNAGALYSKLTGYPCASSTAVTPTTPSTINTTPQAAVSYQGYYFSRELAADEKDYDVLVLQAFLKAKGFLVLPPAQGGSFDLVTRNALAAYQLSVHIAPADGYMGPITRGQINNTIAGTGPVTVNCPAGFTCLANTPTPTTPYVVPQPLPSYPYSSFAYNTNLDIGSRGTDVVRLQTLLESKGFLVMPIGVAKGEYDALTKSAVAAFEASVGISPADGVFGAVARAYVNANFSITTVSSATPIKFTSQSSDETWTDMFGYQVSWDYKGDISGRLQLMLENDSTYCDLGLHNLSEKSAVIQVNSMLICTNKTTRISVPISGTYKLEILDTGLQPTVKGGYETVFASGRVTIRSSIQNPPSTPRIESVSSQGAGTFEVYAGEPIIIKGSNLRPPTYGDDPKVYFDNVWIYNDTVTNDTVSIKAPKDKASGIYPLYIQATEGKTNVVMVTLRNKPGPVTPPPAAVVTSISPTSAVGGNVITINGSGFVSNSYVAFSFPGMEYVWKAFSGGDITSITPTQIQFTLNKDFADKAVVGEYKVFVVNGSNVSNTVPFTLNQYELPASVKCPQSVVVGGATFTLSPCSINVTMTDGKGDLNFSTTIVTATSTSYGYSTYGYGVGLPTYAILGGSSGGAGGSTTLDLHFTDSILNSNGSTPRTYVGYLPIHIYQGSESGNSFLNFNFTVTVNPASN